MACASKMSDYPIRRDNFSFIEKGLKFFKDKGYILKSVYTISFGEVMDDAIIEFFYFPLLYIFYSKLCKVGVICYNSYMERFDFAS